MDRYIRSCLFLFQPYQVYEKDTVFGTIEGEISGYFIHYEPEEVTVEIEPTVNTNEEYITPPHYQEEEKVLTNISTGDKQTSGPYIREKVLDTNLNGTPTWNDWKYIPPPKDKITFWSLLRTFFSYLFLPLLFIPLLLFGWRIFLPILIIYLFSIVLNFFSPIHILRFFILFKVRPYCIDAWVFCNLNQAL